MAQLKKKKAALTGAANEVVVSGGFAVVADVHLANHARFGGPMVDGINARGRLILDALAAACEAAKKRRCWVLFVAGDLFHTRRPEPAIIAAVQRLFEEQRLLGLTVVVIPGNHDLLDAGAEGGNTACAPLWQSTNLVDRPAWIAVRDGDVLAVPFTARVPMAMHLLEVLSTVGKQKFGTRKERTLVTHVGVWDDTTATSWQRRAKDGINATVLFDLMEKAGITTAFVGNYHEQRTWTRAPSGDPSAPAIAIVQVGTLCPGGFGDAGLKNRGSMWIQDSRGALASVEVLGPRFVDVDDRFAGVLSYEGADRARFFLRLKGVELDPHNQDGWGGVERVDTSSFGPSIEGGKQEGSPVDSAEALRFHVEQLPLAEGVDRAAVLDLVNDCWKRGA
jgi:3',5'-cyclic AMP phosphodiesterase CpdA